MNRESYEQMIADAKAEAADMLGHNPSPQRIQHALDTLATRVAAATRSYHLLNLMGVDDVATELGIDVGTVRQVLIRRNRDAPIGRKLGNSWVVDIDELPTLRQDRRRKEAQ